MIIARVHKKINAAGIEECVLAVCDKELLGKVWRGSAGCIDLVHYKDFYEGRIVSEKEAIELMKNAGNMNLVGKKALEAARKAFRVSEASVKKIGGVPHLQVYRI